MRQADKVARETAWLTVFAIGARISFIPVDEGALNAKPRQVRQALIRDVPDLQISVQGPVIKPLRTA